MQRPNEQPVPTLPAASHVEVTAEEADRALRRRIAMPALPPERCADQAEPRQPGPVQFTQGSVQEEATDFRLRPERLDPIARLTVYALNGSVLLFFFPLGFALLIFNIIGGENLRTTAHTMALTGLGTALVTSGYAAQLVANI